MARMLTPVAKVRMMMMRLIPLCFRTSAASEIKVQLKEHKMVFTDPDQWISFSFLFWMRCFLLEKLLWLRSFSWSNQAGWLIMCNQPCGCWRFCCRTRLFWWKTTCQWGRALSQRFPSGASLNGSGADWTSCEPEKNRILTKRFFF